MTRLKVVLVGDSAAGKTSLVWRAVNPSLPLPEFQPTVLRNEMIPVPMGEDVHEEVMIWDTAGQEDYDRLRPLAYPGTHAVLMLCSKSAYTTILNLKFKWDKEIKNYLPSREVVKVLVVNKNDLTEPDNENETLVTEEIAQKAKEDLKMDAVFMTSALTGENIKEMLHEVVRLCKEPKRRKRDIRYCKVL